MWHDVFFATWCCKTGSVVDERPPECVTNMHQDQSSLPLVRRKDGSQPVAGARKGSGKGPRQRPGESRRAAFARPRVLLAAVAAVVAGSAVWASAQSSKPGASKPGHTKPAAPAKASSFKSGPLKLSDLPELVRAASLRQRSGGAASSGDGAEISPQPERFGLTERDLTPGTVSDDRQPAYSTAGSFLAFVSNRSNTAGSVAGAKYHIWIMGRDGSGLRQVTGLTLSGPNEDDNVDQWQPAFSPDGNQIAYKSLGLFQSTGATPVNTRNADNLFVVQPFVNTTTVPPFEQRTFFQTGSLDRPTFGANGLSIAFGDTANLDNAAGDTGGEYDIFSISPTGSPSSLRRLTGGAADPAGASAQDRQPAFSLVNPDVLYFTSTRANGASRIFLMGADGTNKQQITNPADAAAVDEYPAPSLSLNAFTERVAFQSNRLAAADDATRDTNIWSISFSTAGLGPAPTATPVPTPKLVVSAFQANTLYEFDPATGGFPVNAASTNNLGSPEGVIFGPDLNNDGYPEVLVSNRGQNSVDAYDGITLSFVETFATDASLKNPTALVYTGAPGSLNGVLYVDSGFGQTNATPPVVTSTNKIHRYFVNNGVATPAPAGGQTGSLFSNGNDGVTNGLEGLALSGNTLYASALLQNKITAYNAGSGAFTADAVAPGLGGLSLPTGIAFGPGGLLYVCSSGSDDVKRYNVNTNAYVDDFVSDNNGATFGLESPENLAFGPDGNLYVTALNLPGSSGFNGRYILRFGGPLTGNAKQPLPAAGTTAVPGAAQNAVFGITPGNDGPASLAFFPSVINATPTPTATGVATATPTPSSVESATNLAFLESNTLSAPSLVAANRLDPSQEDNAADREPSFSRSVADTQTTAQLAFASTRLRASVPNATVVNPSGGPDLSIGGGSDVNRSGGGPTHDIWITNSQDFVPPVLVPIGAGNVQYPVVAPGPQAPFFAPRTFEDGLTAGVPVQIAVVFDERESGLNQTGSVTATFYNADQNRFATSTSTVNEKVSVRINRELKPRSIGTANLTSYDDGPITAGGHERQAGAVRGDGVYYCEGTFTPPTQGDFYFDVAASDRDGNSFTYDNIWGFSNRPFAKSSPSSDLFVSDYAQGQNFPTRTGDPRFADQSQPVESYFLTNPATIAQNPVGIQPETTTFGLQRSNFFNNSTGADVWRILCRGPVPEQVLAAYAPTITTVTTAVDAQGNPTQTGSLPLASSSVIWASPYTGTVFSGPGTLADSETQRRLTNFLNTGGRLFVTGRDVAYTLSAAGQLTNNFLRDELGAGFGGETNSPVNTIAADGTGASGKFTFYENAPAGSLYNKGDFNNLQMPVRGFGVPVVERGENTFLDAATNQDYGSFDGGTFMTDVIQPIAPADGILDTAYDIGGKIVGQRIERNGRGPNKLQSKAVFFSFGLEGVNRRYTLATVNNVVTAYAVNVRPILATNLLSYFKTGGFSGQVVNDNTNLPVPNFLLQIRRGKENYFVRTDQNGNYEINGLENTFFETAPNSIGSLDSFGVAPATRVDPNDATRRLSLNPGFLNSFAGTPRGVGIQAPAIQQGVNFRVIPAPLASVSGVATQSNGTFDFRSDDSVLPNVKVLLRSVSTSSIFPGGGKFAALTTTDAGGRFSFANVPTDTDIELIFNPDGSLESQGGDIPDASGIAPFAANSSFGRRLIPDSQRPQTIHFDSASATAGNNFVLNDGANDTVADDPLKTDAGGNFISGGPILVPVGRTIAGKVFLNGAPLPGATVTITSPSNAAFNRTPKTTTSTGSYSFFDVPAGTYTVTASLAFAGRTLTGSINVTVDTSQVRDPIVPNIILRKQGVSGLVTVNGAAPGAPLKVELLDASGNVVQTQQTNAAGAYLFADVPAGTYAVRATRNGASVTSAAFVVAVFAAGPPATGGDAVAPTIDITALNLSGVVTVNGVGTPGLSLQVLDAAGRVAGTTTSGAGGAFAFADLLSGNYTLVSSVAGRNGTDTTSVAVGLSTDRANVVVPLFLYTLRGTVRLNGAPIAGQRVDLFQNGVVIATVTSDAAGGYAIDRLVASPAGTAFQLQATRIVGTTLVTDQTPLLTVVIARSINQSFVIDVPPLDLVKQTIAGRVLLNGRGVSGAVIQLLQGKRIVTFVRSVGGGAYRFNEIPAGTFVLRAIYQGDTVDRTVTIARGANLTGIDLRLLLQSIRGRVLLNGRVLASQVVELLQAGRVVQRARTDRTGVYLFSSIVTRAGVRVTYVVRTTRKGFTAQQTVPTVTRSGLTYVVRDLLLLSQTIRATVRLNGVPTAKAVVDLLLGATPVKRLLTDARGQASFTDLAPGRYTVRAAQGGDTVQAIVNVSANGLIRIYDVALNLLLGSVQGTILANTTPISGQLVEIIRNNVVVASATSDARGHFTFSKLAIGTYTLRATRNGVTISQTVTIARGANISVTLKLALQSVSGLVTLDGRPAKGVSVTLMRGTTLVSPAVTTLANGAFSFGGVAPGTYVLTATVTVAGRTVSLRRAVVVRAGRDTVVPTLALTTPPPDSAGEEFQPGSSYQISVPYTDSTSPYSTTTVSRAFSVPPTGLGGEENYRLFRFNALSREYEPLGGNSLIRRGEGYFLQPQARGVSIKRPATDRSRRPTGVTEFEITLRVNPSSPQGQANNGFNLIGFPFDPARFTTSSWKNATVIAPDGRRFSRLSDAVGAGLVSDTLFTLDTTNDTYTPLTDNLMPFKGYYARTFVDGVRVILHAGNAGP